MKYENHCRAARGRTNRLGIVLLFVSIGLGLRADPTYALAQIDLDAPVLFFTVASGLVPTTGDDSAIAIARFELESEEQVTESITNLPGFLIVSSGQVILTSDGAVVAVLGAGDARWLDAVPAVSIRSIDGPATFWRTAIGPDVNGRDLDGEDPYTFEYVSFSEAVAGEVHPWIVRMALVPAGETVQLGDAEQNVAYVLVVSGDVEVDGSELESGDYVSPFFGNPDVSTMATPALVAFIARGVPISVNR